MNNQAKNVIKNTGTRSLTCIICPRGCLLEVELGENIAVSGNLCPRGKVYAENECTNPQRTVTSTVRCSDGGVVAVKTESTVPKGRVGDCMREINLALAKLPVRVGDVIIDDICGLGVRLVATQNKG